MFDIIAAVNNEDILTKNLLRSPLLKNVGASLQLQKGYRSAAVAYNAGLKNCTNDYVVFVHQDVYIPLGWELKIARHIAYLDKVDPNWAVLGLFGAMKSGQHVGYVWSSGLNSKVGEHFDTPMPVDSVDELLIILKKSSGLSYDEGLPGFHLYGTDLVQSALEKGKSAYVVCAPVIHNSIPILYLKQDYFAAYEFIADKWKERLPIQNCVCPIVESWLVLFKVKIKHQMRKLRYYGVNRESLDRQYDSVEFAKKLGME
jgi:glycosyltransferase involved in cell wall biosynthesis